MYCTPANVNASVDSHYHSLYCEVRSVLLIFLFHASKVASDSSVTVEATAV